MCLLYQRKTMFVLSETKTKTIKKAQVLMARRLISCGKFSDRFVLGKYLSEGSFAKVFMATAVERNPEPGKGLPPPPAEFAVKRTARQGLSDFGEQCVYDEVRDIYVTGTYVVSKKNVYLCFGRVFGKTRQAACYQCQVYLFPGRRLGTYLASVYSSSTCSL